MKKACLLSICLLLAFILGNCGNNTTPVTFISGIRESLPASWQMTVIDKEGEIGHPHGLKEPLFRIDFLDTEHYFFDAGGRQYSPSARLYIYDIVQQKIIMATIVRERMYSWDIPEYYDRTKDYIIVTSPSYINGGHYNNEAVYLFQPLDMALKEYFSRQR
jgi:hypothetical protein